MRIALSLLLLLCLALALPTRAAEPDPLLLDLTEGQVSINTGFAGQRVVLFGAMAGPGDLIVVVEGPARTYTVRQKQRRLGLWLNGAAATFREVPSFYVLASTRPLETILPHDLLESHEIGLDYLYLQPDGADLMPPGRVQLFRTALIDQKRARGTFKQFDGSARETPAAAPLGDTAEGEIRLRGDRLFRTAIDFPDNVPTGRYSATVFLVQNGAIVDSATTPLAVEKVGVAARVSAFARQWGGTYGLAGITIAVAMGWLASLMFRRS